MSKLHTVVAGSLALGLSLIAAASGTAGSGARGEQATITFTRALSLPGVTLAPGAYLFEVAESPGSIDIVRVSSRATGKPQFLGFTDHVARPASLKGLSAVRVGEARAGEAAPITVWYPADGSHGRRFRY
jgi:hypothetical protein